MTDNMTVLTKLKNELHALKNTLFYKEEEVKNLKYDIEKKQEQLLEHNIIVVQNCEHEWENDFIDSMIPYRLSQPIRYCTKCELTDCTTFNT